MARLLIRMFRYGDNIVSFWRNGAIVNRLNNKEYILVHLLDQNDNLNGNSF